MRRTSGVAAVSSMLRDLDDQGRVEYLGIDRPDGEYGVVVNGNTRLYPAPAMFHWASGYTAALEASTQPAGPLDAARRRAEIADVRRLLMDPSASDQVRMRVRLAMQEQGLTLAYLMETLGVTRKALFEALQLGRGGTIGVIGVVGLVDLRGPVDVPDDAPLPVCPPKGSREPDIVARLRWLGYAYEGGILNAVDPLTVPGGSQATEFTVRIAGAAKPTTVRGEHLQPWLVGACDVLDHARGEALYHAPNPVPRNPQKRLTTSA